MDAPINPSKMEMEDQLEVEDVVDVYLFKGLTFIHNYGWYILGTTIVLLYLWSKIKPYVHKWLKDKEDREFYARYHKDPDLALRRHEALERARRKLAEKYEADAKRAAEKRKELEEKKRQEWLLRQEGNVPRGHRLNEDSDSGSTGTNENDGRGNGKRSARLKDDYNPLMGGGSRGYRPSRRSTCPSGGCR